MASSTGAPAPAQPSSATGLRGAGFGGGGSRRSAFGRRRRSAFGAGLSRGRGAFSPGWFGRRLGGAGFGTGGRCRRGGRRRCWRELGRQWRELYLRFEGLVALDDRGVQV